MSWVKKGEIVPGAWISEFDCVACTEASVTGTAALPETLDIAAMSIAGAA